jgi:branched-chain amino acid transport system ATP-binding protein
MSPENAPILNVSGLVKRFGGFFALDGLSFHVAAGEILGLVGPNGSGKTTAINVISGLYAPDGGEVTLDGASIGGVASHRLVHRGINRTFQIPKPFLSLTVRQNVEVALAYGRAAVTSCSTNIASPISPNAPPPISTTRSRRCSIWRARLRPVRACCCLTNSPPD